MLISRVHCLLLSVSVKLCVRSVCQPKFAILDECTSAVSDEVEGTIYQTSRLLGITIFTVSHRPQLAKFHDVILKFEGATKWSVTKIESDGGSGQKVLTTSQTNTTTIDTKTIAPAAAPAAVASDARLSLTLSNGSEAASINTTREGDVDVDAPAATSNGTDTGSASSPSAIPAEEQSIVPGGPVPIATTNTNTKQGKKGKKKH